MGKVYRRWKSAEKIEVTPFLKQRKMKKYLNRESAAAITTLGILLQSHNAIPGAIPIVYAAGDLAFEDYGLESIAFGSRDGNARFSEARFVQNGLANVSPLSQFKILQNMPLCFSAIVFGLTGENAVVYNDASGVILFAGQLNESMMLAGAGDVHGDGSVEAVFVLCPPKEILRNSGRHTLSAIEFLKILEVE